MKRLLKYFLAVALLCAVPVVVTSCGGKDVVTPEPDPKPVPDPPKPVPPDPTEKLPSFSTYVLGESFEIPLDGKLNLPYSGIKKGDRIIVTPRTSSDSPFTLECTEATDTTGGDFSVSGVKGKYIGGMGSVAMNVGGRNVSGKVFINVVDKGEVARKAGYTLYGRVVDWNGKPVEGVVVSDAIRTAKTDADGCYYLLNTDRKYGYVFISTPKNYRVAIDRAVPQFYQYLKSKDTSEPECHNFVLAPESNVHHSVMVFTDVHIGNRNEVNDVQQYNTGFKPDIAKRAAEAKTAGAAFYCISLGDQSWDQYWYKNKFSPKEYRELISDQDVAIYNIPGNHDNDEQVIGDDFKASEKYRLNLGPTHYSFNIGDIHYVMMDNTIFNNKGGDVQDYTEGFTDDEMKWLDNDLKMIPAGSTVFLGMHIQYSSRPREQADGTFTYTYYMPAEFRSFMLDEFTKYNLDVHILSGHTHINFTNFISSRLTEHNIASVCSTWWWTGFYTNMKCNLCGDGSASGYMMFDNGAPASNSVDWHYQPFKRDVSYQFRAYDLNNCLVDKATYCPHTSKGAADIKSAAHGYDASRSDNKLLVNVFAWNDKCTLTATENNTPLKVTRKDAYDPLHVVQYNMNRLEHNLLPSSFDTNVTSHMFEIQCLSSNGAVVLTFTDQSGHKYSEAVSRPRRLVDMSKEDKW